MLILKIFRKDEWQILRKQGETCGAPIDLADGFIHFSTLEQAPETAALHFAGADDLMLVGVETERLGDDLKWEASRGGALFPHLFRELRLSDVKWAQPLPLGEDGHLFPPGME